MSVHTGGGATVVMDPPPTVYVKVFHPGSMPDRNLKARAERVAIYARALAPRRTYALRGSIRATQNRDELGQFAFAYRVSANTPYAYYVHAGTDPSVRVMSGKKSMRFSGTKAHAGRVVFTKVVKHPGTPRNPFLKKALVAMVGR